MELIYLFTKMLKKKFSTDSIPPASIWLLLPCFIFIESEIRTEFAHSSFFNLDRKSFFYYFHTKYADEPHCVVSLVQIFIARICYICSQITHNHISYIFQICSTRTGFSQEQPLYGISYVVASLNTWILTYSRVNYHLSSSS